MDTDCSIDKQWEKIRKDLEEKGFTAREQKEIYGEALKELRKKQKMTILQAAEKSGFSQGRISNYETGKTVPSLDDLQILLLTYNSSLYEFLGVEKANYSDDLDVFRRYGLTDSFFQILYFAKYYDIHKEIVDCINLIFSYPMYAFTLFEAISKFFNRCYHKQVNLSSLDLPPESSARLLLEPVIHQFINIFDAEYPEWKTYEFLSAAKRAQTEVLTKLYEEVREKEKKGQKRREMREQERQKRAEIAKKRARKKMESENNHN